MVRVFLDACGCNGNRAAVSPRNSHLRNASGLPSLLKNSAGEGSAQISGNL
jgi:hypothetical protein